jgi:oxygen-dependent protoporphyrinogen oxidase
MTSAVVSGQDKRHVVIVGGGISGLSAAWYAQQSDAAVTYTLLEASGRWGGKVQTEQVDDVSDAPFVIEAGPDSFLTQKPWALQLARELGLADRLLDTNDQMRTVYVLHRGKPVKMPDGVQMIVPTRLMPFVSSPLLSPLAKLRMGLDLLISPKADDRDETLADFVRRRFGNEVLDKIAEPIMSGIYNADAEQQSILATFARFRQLEREHGSLIRGMLASRQQSKQDTSKLKQSTFVSLRGGTQELVDALVSQLKGDLRLSTSVTVIAQGEADGYHVTTRDGDTLHADAVILTMPAYAMAALLRPLVPAAANALASIRYVSTGTISMGFRIEDIKQPLHGFGLVIPKSEQRPINAITISSTKFAHRAPDDHVLIRVFFGGSRSPATMAFDDEKLVAVVRQELRAILGIEATPLFHRVYRLHYSSPQYDVDHLKRIEAIEAALPSGIYVTGSAFRGVGLPDCIHQSQLTVNKVIAQLRIHEVTK